jgi:antagonist of KipI
MTLRIEKEGLFTSIQDLGRFGGQRFGVNPRGAMDPTAARIINLLLGNDENESVLEFHFPGPEIVFGKECIFALGGADFAAELDSEPIRNWRAYTASASSVLRFSRKVFGNRCYLAINGGLRTTGGEPANVLQTERIKKGQRISRGRSSEALSPLSIRSAARSILPIYSRFPTARILVGAEFLDLSDEDKTLLETAIFTISNESNRMGSRLIGPALSLNSDREMVSAAVTFGTIQLVPDGQLIILLADHQTSGGYPRVGNIISADLSLVAQLGPGDKLAFKIVDIAEAERVSAQLETDLKKLKTGVSFGRYW